MPVQSNGLWQALWLGQRLHSLVRWCIEKGMLRKAIMLSLALSLLGCPSERVMVQAQVQQQGFLHVVRNTGLRGLYHGWQATLYRDVSFNCFFFTSREIFVRSWKNYYNSDPSAWQRVLLGIPSGVIGSVLACPLDVVKTRVQGKEIGE